MTFNFTKTHKKYTFYFLTYGLMLFVMYAFVGYNFINKAIDQTLEQQIDFQFERSADSASFFMNSTKDAVKAISHSDFIEEYVNRPNYENLKKLEDLMQTSVKAIPNLFQLRYLDRSGKEVVRLDHFKDAANKEHFLLAPASKLQDKSDRYYFKAAEKLSDGDIYISPLDLNVEHGKIETPHRPVIRFVIPVVSDTKNQVMGYIIANMDATRMVNRFTQTTELDIFLVDKEGYFIYSSVPKLRWTKYLGSKQTLKSAFGKTLASIKNENETYSYFDLSPIIPNGEGITLIAKPNAFFFDNMKKDIGISALLFFALILVITIILSAIIAFSPAKANEQLELVTEKNNLYSKIINQHVPIIDTDLDGIITSCNNAMCELSGYRKVELVGQNASILQGPNVHPKNFSKMWQDITDGKSWKGEIHNQTKQGQSFWLSSYIAPKYDEAGHKNGYISISTDISDRINLERYSEHDQLTGLSNRSKINKVMQELIKSSHRFNVPFVALLIDIDYFKKVNDTHGHLVGDEVLKAIANILRYSVRETDHVSRWGGEEFLLICPQTDITQGLVVAEKLRQAVENFEYDDLPNVTISIGVAGYEPNMSEIEVIDAADKMLYEAKRTGRNRVVSTIDKYREA